MGVVVLVILIITTIIYIQLTQVSSDYGDLPELEKVDLEVPLILRTIWPFKEARQLFVPKQYGIRVYAYAPRARFLLALPNGDVLVSQPNLGSISLLQPPTSPDEPAERLDFATGLNLPHDMVFYTDKNGDNYIYIAETDKVARYRYTDGNISIDSPEVLIDHLPSNVTLLHQLKNIAIGNNTLYLSIASNTNADPQNLKEDPKQGAIYAYTLTGGERRLVSEGVRNAEGLAFAPGTGDLWVVINQRDRVKYPYNDNSGNYGKIIPDYVDDNPPEEFGKIEEGKNYSWPFCNPVAVDSMDNLEYVPDYDNNPDESVVKCDTFRIAEKGMEPHSAPLGLTFWTGENVPDYFKNGALVGLHGSWNRQAFSGHKVVFYPWVNGRPGNAYDLVSGWVIDPVEKIRWGRPVDTAVLQDGSVLISDDFTGAIYELYKKS